MNYFPKGKITSRSVNMGSPIVKQVFVVEVWTGKNRFHSFVPGIEYINSF